MAEAAVASVTPLEPVRKGKIFERAGVMAVRLRIAAGNTVPTHSANVDVFATVVTGRGTFVIDGKNHALAPGVVIEMSPNVPHSLTASEDLELVVLHCRLEGTAAVEPHCGASSPGRL